MNYTPIASKSKTFLIRQKKEYISKRTIMRIINAAAKQSATKASNYSAFNEFNSKPYAGINLRSNNYSFDHTSTELQNRTYASYSVNRPDPNSNHPQAKNNNPPSPHPEIHRMRCDHSSCNGSVCIGLCGNFIDRKAIAHATHGNPPQESGKKKVKLSNQDFNGQNKPQNAIIYEDAHYVNTTTEYTLATQKINQDSHVMAQLKQYEDKK